MTNIADNSSHFMNLTSSILSGIGKVWNYSIYVGDKQPITLANIIVGIILFIVSLRVARYLSRLLRTKLLDALKLDKDIADAFEKMSHYMLIIFFSIFVLEISHVPLTVFTFVGGALAVGVGFGSQNLLNNFISGLVIMVEHPIRVGDTIELMDLNNTIGKVVDIGARCIHVRTMYNIDILVPNRFILENIVINWTLNDSSVRVSSYVLIDIHMDTVKTEKLLYKSLVENEHILKTPRPEVFLVAFAPGAIKFEVTFCIDLLNTTQNRKSITSQVNQQICQLLQKNNIKLAPGYCDFSH